MKHAADSIAHGSVSAVLVTVAGFQDLVSKCISGLIVVAITSVASHLIKKALRRREWSKKAKEMHERRFPHEPPPH